MSRIVPLTGSEASRTTKAALISAGELHTTSDQQRVFFENRILAPYWHGLIADETAMLQLANRHSGAGVSAAESDNSLNDAGGFPDDWVAGDILTVDGFADPANNGTTFEIDSVSAGKLVLTGASATLVDEAAGATVTITRNGKPGCWPGDKCKRTDLGTIWECVTGNGKELTDWVEIGGGDRVGTIKLWAGTVANIQSGWQLCDGTNGTPNLADKFILGTNTEADIGTSGGSSQHKHAVGTLADTAASAGTPAVDAHTTAAVQSGAGTTVVTGPASHTGTPLAAHSHGLTGKTADAENGAGSTAAADILPPWFKLAFIMRVS